MMKRFFAATLVCICINSFASIQKPTSEDVLLKKFSQTYKTNQDYDNLKKETLALKSKAVPSLIKVMKDGNYPDKNRWMATFLLGKIMGDKSAPFISKFTKHPSWVMRMASLKTLLALKQKQYVSSYQELLKDNSMLVRSQALSNIRELKISEAAPHVWAMLYDKRNYHSNSKDQKHKRMDIIKNVVKTVGELQFKKATNPLLTMIQKDRYNDIFEELNYALSQITGMKPTKNEKEAVRLFWKSKEVSFKTI